MDDQRVVAELLVVMARVPKSEGHRGGISAFVVEADSPGITVERRNSFMGLRGIENGVTRLHKVRVPKENLIGREGDGLKIALTTLNAGRLAIPAMCSGAGKWALKIAREWSSERVQWGKPVGEHEAVAAKISFIAATTYALESVVELSGQMNDEQRNDIRIEAALAKLWASEMGCLIADELVQIRGGRGYETAESLAARGERAVPAEQLVRDLRINRIFEGSSEIMRLLVAREAVDAHLRAAGELADPDSTGKEKAQAAVRASGFYARWLPKLVAGKGQLPRTYNEFGSLAPHLRYIERSSRKLARSTFYGMARWQAGLEKRENFLGRIVDIGGELFAATAVCVRAERQRVDGHPEADAASNWPTPSASSRGCVWRSCSTPCGRTPTPRTVAPRPAFSRVDTSGSSAACSIRARAPARGSPAGNRVRRPRRTSRAGSSTPDTRCSPRTRSRPASRKGVRAGSVVDRSERQKAPQFDGAGSPRSRASMYETDSGSPPIIGTAWLMMKPGRIGGVVLGRNCTVAPLSHQSSAS